MVNSWLSHYTKFTAFATFLLLCAGALVTSTGSGLAVPDWPLSYGQFFPPMIGGILFEHGHRMIAGIVGILVLIQAIWIGIKEPRRWIRQLAFFAFLLIVIQAVLGGLTVIFLLPDFISIGHAALAEIFFCVVVSMALFTSCAWSGGGISNDSHCERNDLPAGSVTEVISGSFWILSILTTVSIYIQILLGAYYRHTESGITGHIIGAIAVTGMIGGYASQAFKVSSQDTRIVKLALLMLVILMLQFILGPAALIAKVMTRDLIQPHILKVILTVAHLALGALLLGLSLVSTLWIYRSIKLKREGLSFLAEEAIL